MLKNQNDQIRQMLEGKLDPNSSKPTLEPIDPTKVRSLRGSSLRASQTSLNSQRNFMQAGTPQLEQVKQDSIGGTPGKNSLRGKAGDTMRSRAGGSVQKAPSQKMMAGKHAFGHTITAADKKSIASSSQRDPLNDDSFEMEDWDDVMEKI